MVEQERINVGTRARGIRVYVDEQARTLAEVSTLGLSVSFTVFHLA